MSMSQEDENFNENLEENSHSSLNSADENSYEKDSFVVSDEEDLESSNE